MKDSQPFQFSLKAVLLFTAVVAVLAWLVSGLRPSPHPYALAYLLIGCGQILFTLGIWKHLNPSEWQSRRGEAFDVARLGFLLSIPTWLVYVAVLAHERLDIPINPEMFVGLWVLLLVLQVPALMFNGLAWFLYIRPLQDWPLMVLRTLNLASSAILLIVVYEMMT